MLGDQREKWLAARLQDLHYGDIDSICTAARAYPLVGVNKDEVDKALGYARRRALWWIASHSAGLRPAGIGSRPAASRSPFRTG